MEHTTEENSIKANYVPHMRKEDELFNLKRAYQESRRILLEEFKAKRKKLAKRLKDKRTLAWNIGRVLGLKSAKLETEETLMQAKEAYEASLAHANRDCLDLAVSIAMEILQTEVTVNTKSLANRLKKSLDSLMTVEKVIISANEIDIKNLSEELKTLNPGSYNLRTNNTISPGNALIESDRGVIELNWLSQLTIIEKQLRERLENKLTGNKS